MRARPVVAIAAACIGTAAVIAASVWVLLPSFLPPPDIAAKLAVVDSAIAGGYLSTARAELLAIRPVPRGEKDALRVLKRAFLISRETGDFKLLAAVGDRAMAAAGGSPKVRLVAAYACLRAGRASDAEQIASRGLPAGDGDLVRGELLLKRGDAWQGSDALTRQLLALDGSQKPTDFTAAARLVDDKRLYLDAALLSLGTGDIAGARAIASSNLQNQTFDEPASLIAYDSGDFETAISRLSRLQQARAQRADIDLLIGDCYHALGRTADFEAALQEALAVDPRVSWTPYANLGHLEEKRGDIAQARAALAQGRAVFPASRELVLAAARLEADQGNTTTAVTLLDVLVAERPDDAPAALLRLDLKAPGMPPQAWRAELWKLFDRLPSDRTVFLRLASSLIASHDWEGLAMALRQHGEAGGAADADALSMQALLQAVGGDDEKAVLTLQEAVRAADEGQGGKYRYDLAVVLLHRGRPQEAISQLDAALGEAAAAPSSSDFARATFPALIETLRGRCLLAMGDLSGARRSFLRARTLDPHQLAPAMELRKLEARGDQ